MDQKTLDNFLKQATTKPIYKSYLPFLKLARDCFTQNPIITYWTLCYVVEASLKNQTKPNDEFRKFLLNIMSCLENEKKARSGDSKFANEKEAQAFIEEYGNKLLEKAEENEELFEKHDLAYKLYLSASNIFQMYTIFVREDSENAKRIKFCKWRAVECFKKKKELEENPSKLLEHTDSQDEPNEEAQSSSRESGVCFYPDQPGEFGVCPYPSGGSNSLPYSNESLSNLPSGNSNSHPEIISPSVKPNPSNDNVSAVFNPSKDKEPKDPNYQLNQDLASLQLTESDSKRAELLCESALYAIRANDLLTAVETLKQTLELLYKRARK